MGTVKAICASCLGPLDVDADAMHAAAAGRPSRTVYASDELAFPGIALPGFGAACARCGPCVAIAVEDEVAATIAARP